MIMTGTAVTKPQAKTSPRPRDRDGTEAHILDTAAKIVARDGFGAVGVNTVAREAGVDKQLIYRYFGGLDGLLERLGQDLRLWLGDAATDGVSGDGYAEVIGGQAVRHLAALRANDMVQAALAWELVERGDAVRKLGQAKNQAIREWFGRVRDAAGDPPPGIDAAAINALVLAGIHHLVLRSRTAGDFAGLDLAAPGTWERVENAVMTITAAVYGDGHDQGGS